MNKKLLATLLVGVIAAGALGLTACGADQLTEEQWRAAIRATCQAENYTAIANGEEHISYTGEADGEAVNSTYDTTNSVKVYYDWTGKKVYQEVELTTKTAGGAHFGDDDVDEQYLYKTYSEIDGAVLRSGYYIEGLGWNASQEDYGVPATLKSNLDESIGATGVFKKISYAQDLNESFLSLDDAYSWFSYEEGLYVAELYVNSESNNIIKEKVTVAVEAGRVTRLQFNSSLEKTALGLTEKGEAVTTYLFSDFGTTTVNPPAEAVEAVGSLKSDPNSSVAGKTFLFESVELMYDSEELKTATWDEFLTLMQTSYEGVTLAFGEWSDFVMTIIVGEDDLSVRGTFEEEGNVITATPESKGGESVEDEPMICVLTNGKLAITQTVGDGVYMMMVFTLTTE